jgi:hypothetical protein
MAETSANTQTVICQEICVGSGTTVTQIIPPNPVYGDLTGGTVTQLNMVVLGGTNGLNS